MMSRTTRMEWGTWRKCDTLAYTLGSYRLHDLMIMAYCCRLEVILPA